MAVYNSFVYKTIASKTKRFVEKRKQYKSIIWMCAASLKTIIFLDVKKKV